MIQLDTNTAQRIREVLSDSHDDAFQEGNHEYAMEIDALCGHLIDGPEGTEPFSIPELDVWFDEAEYLRVSELIGIAASLAGDGAGGELGDNSEYERGMAELIMRSSHCLGVDYLDQIIQAIHNTAKES